MSGKLTATKVSSETKPGRYGDGGGLWLQVSKWGTKSWLLRYMINGQARSMGLGSIDTFTLKEARERSRRYRQQVAEGIDPIKARKAQRMAALAESAKQVAFKDAAEKYITAHRAGWKNEKHAAQWTSSLKTHAYKIIGDMSVADIETAHVLKVLEPIWTTTTETASRVRGRIEAVLDWSTVRGYRQGDNPARLKGHLDNVLPAKNKVKKVKHHEAMPFEEIPSFVATLRDKDSISARALEFTILTAARTGETIGANWSEIDFATKVWTVPGNRTKSGRDHRVPLTDRALEILAGLPREENDEHVFISTRRKGEGLSNMAMRHLLARNNENGLTVHGFRSSFRDWAGEQTNYPREVAEAALAHVLSDRTEAAYRRGDALEKRRRLMQAWAGYCAKPSIGGEVIPMRRKV